MKYPLKGEVSLANAGSYCTIKSRKKTGEMKEEAIQLDVLKWCLNETHVCYSLYDLSFILSSDTTFSRPMKN